MSFSRFRERDAGSIPIGNRDLGYIYWLSGGTWYKISTARVGVLYTPYPLGHETCRDALHPGPPYRTGGPFIRQKWWTTRPNVDEGYVLMSGNGKYRYEGGFMISGPYVLPYFYDQFGFSPGLRDEDDMMAEMLVSGATGWNRARPGQPTAGLGQALAEMRDMPRTLQKTAADMRNIAKSVGGSGRAIRDLIRPSGAGSSHLNIQYGWLPFISDMRRMAEAYVRMDKAISELRRHNGKWLRRRRTVKHVVENEVLVNTNVTAVAPVLNSYFYSTTGGQVIGTNHVEANKLQHDWFVGKFRYWIPDIDTPAWSRKARRTLYGLSISPSLLYEITPWSWLIDWFTNLGDIISNLDNELAENLAAQYAYVMSHNSYSIDQVSTMLTDDGLITVKASHGYESKARMPACPFGFGLTEDLLSIRQWSILGALGLSRLR